MTLVQAVFENTFFVHPDSVRARTPYFPTFARKSRHHYPGLESGAAADWHGQPVKLDTNSRAQKAWEKYSGRAIVRSSGYGVRHIWGNPWDPVGFTAGWNLAYMPFWAGMLTEDQHPHPLVQTAIKQAGWELFFRDNPVCDQPDFVGDPGLDLDEVLDGQPLLVMEARSVGDAMSDGRGAQLAGDQRLIGNDLDARVVAIRRELGNSWSNLRKAVAALQNLDHEPFGTRNVENNSKSHIRRILRETGTDLVDLAETIERLAPPDLG